MLTARMNPFQFFLSLVNLDGLVILIPLDIVTTVDCATGGLSLESRGVPSGTGLIMIVPIHPVLVLIGHTNSPW